MANTDPIAIIDLIFRYVPDALPDQDKKFILFETLKRFLNGYEVSKHEDLDNLEVVPSTMIKEFFSQFWDFLLRPVDQSPTYQVCYLAAKW